MIAIQKAHGFEQNLDRLADGRECERAGDVGRGPEPAAAVQIQSGIRPELRPQAAHGAVGLRVAHVLE